MNEWMNEWMNEYTVIPLYIVFFLKYFSFFSEWLNYCDIEKSVYNVQYRIYTEYILRKKSDLKYFENQILFYFLIENLVLTNIPLDVYFPLSFFWVVKILVILLKKNILFESVFNVKHFIFTECIFRKKTSCEKAVLYCKIKEPVSQ